MSDSNWRELFKTLKEQGWAVENTKGQHIKLVPPNDQHQIIIVASSPSCHRAFKNTLSRCRKSGANV